MWKLRDRKYSARGDAEYDKWGGRSGRTARELEERVEKRLSRASGKQVDALEYHNNRPKGV